MLSAAPPFLSLHGSWISKISGRVPLAPWVSPLVGHPGPVIRVPVVYVPLTPRLEH